MKKTACLVLCIAVKLNALTVSPEAVKSQLESAALIADILVLNSETRSDQTFYANSQTQAELIQIHYKNPALTLPNSHETITIETPGGEVQGKGMLYSGFPKPRNGLRYKAYLNPKEGDSHTFTITGFESGLVPLQPTRSFSRNRTDGSNGSGNGSFLFWDSSYFPIPFFISAPSFTGLPEFIPAIEESFKTWRSPNDVKLEFISMGCSQNVHNENDGINSVILIQDKWPFDAAAIAITRNFYVAGEDARAGLILDSDILLNGVNHHFTTTNETGKHDMQNIVTHEVGHFIGLGHEAAPADSDATMYAIASVNETKKRALHSSDLLGLRSAYLGVGQKFEGTANHCTVPKANVGCASVPNRPFSLSGQLGAFLYLIITLALGRAISQKKN